MCAWGNSDVRDEMRGKVVLSLGLQPQRGCSRRPAGQQRGGREVLGDLNMDTIYRAWKKKNPLQYHLACKRKKKKRAQQQHLRKPYCSHLLTEASACDAVPKVARMSPALKCKFDAVLSARSVHKTQGQRFHAKQMIPFHKEDPAILKRFLLGFFSPTYPVFWSEMIAFIKVCEGINKRTAWQRSSQSWI